MPDHALLIVGMVMLATAFLLALSRKHGGLVMVFAVFGMVFFIGGVREFILLAHNSIEEPYRLEAADTLYIMPTDGHQGLMVTAGPDSTGHLRLVARPFTGRHVVEPTVHAE